jgi:hypothetical protein
VNKEVVKLQMQFFLRVTVKEKLNYDNIQPTAQTMAWNAILTGGWEATDHLPVLTLLATLLWAIIIDQDDCWSKNVPRMRSAHHAKIMLIPTQSRASKVQDYQVVGHASYLFFSIQRRIASSE